jgi:hypothetical protein
LELPEATSSKIAISGMFSPLSMAKRNNNPRTILMMALLFSILALFPIAADAQMNRDSPSFETRIPRMTDSFLTSPPQTTSPATPYLNAYPLRYPSPPDISIFPDQQNTTCRQVSFIVTLTTSSNSPSPSGNQAVKVRVTDKVFGNQQAVAEVVLLIPGSGGSTAATIGYPLPEDASAAPGWTNDVIVVVDPDNHVEESDESNNNAIIAGVCN